MKPSLLLSPNVLSSIKNSFLAELHTASKGTANSIAYLRHPLPVTSILAPEELFQVMVVGGSLFKNALIQIKKGYPSIVSYEKSPLPVLESAQLLYEVVQKNLHPAVSKISLNFTYPMKPEIRDGLLDGLLIKGTKEHAFKGLVGQKVGYSLEEFFRKQGRTLRFAVANDTVCLALAGLTQQSIKQHIVAGVVGTGMNFALFHDNHTVVNLESGNFDKFEQSPAGMQINSLFPETNGQHFEKEVSGAYLFHHFNYYAKLQGFAARLNSTEELNSLSKSPTREGQLASQILERSASLVACQIAGIAEFLTPPPDTFVCFMEGGLFWDGIHYKAHVEKYLSLLTKATVSFSRIDKSSVLGPIFLFTPPSYA